MSELIIHVAKENAPFKTEDGKIQYSMDGHMFIELRDKEGRDSWGFQPHGVIPNEHKFYRETTKISFDITEAQARKVRAFAQEAENSNDVMGEWLPTNSCVDFAWKALNKAGIKSPSAIWNEGKFYPEDNIKLLREAQELLKIKQKHSALLPDNLKNSLNYADAIDNNLHKLIQIKHAELMQLNEQEQVAFAQGFDENLSKLFESGRIANINPVQLEQKLEKILSAQLEHLTQQTTPNQFGISPALKASLDAQAQENLQNQQGQGRGLG